MSLETLADGYGVRRRNRRLLFTKSSTWDLRWTNAVKYASDLGADLQSMREAAIFRMEAKGADYSDREQITRTGALFIVRNGKVYVAFDDDIERNLIISHASSRCGTRSHNYFAPLMDEGLQFALERAEKTGRIAEVQEIESLELQLTMGKNGFSLHPIVQAILGDVSRDYARYSRIIREGQYQGEYMYQTVSFPPASYIIYNTGYNALLRPVLLWPIETRGSIVIADSDGFARGVIREQSAHPQSFP